MLTPLRSLPSGIPVPTPRPRRYTAGPTFSTIIGSSSLRILLLGLSFRLATSTARNFTVCRRQPLQRPSRTAAQLVRSNPAGCWSHQRGYDRPSRPPGELSERAGSRSARSARSSSGAHQVASSRALRVGLSQVGLLHAQTVHAAARSSSISTGRGPLHAQARGGLVGSGRSTLSGAAP